MDIYANKYKFSGAVSNPPTIEYFKDTFFEYLGKKDYISASDIKTFLKSPRLYYYDKFEKEHKVEQRYFSVGSGLHEIILEPELFNENYIISPKFDLRTKAGKEGAAEFAKTAEGKVILMEDEMDMIRKIAEVAIKNEVLTELLNGSYRELSIYTTDPITGLKVRLRPDSFCTDKSTITDIKSCMDSSPRKFKKDVYTYEYSLSAAYYMDFAKKENYVFAACAKTAPYEIAIYVLSDEMIEYGRKQYRMGLDLLKWCFDNNHWPSYNEFELLKESYELGNLDDFFENKDKSRLITILG